MKILLIYSDSRKELIGRGDIGAIAEPLARHGLIAHQYAAAGHPYFSKGSFAQFAPMRA